MSSEAVTHLVAARDTTFRSTIYGPREEEEMHITQYTSHTQQQTDRHARKNEDPDANYTHARESTVLEFPLPPSVLGTGGGHCGIICARGLEGNFWLDIYPKNRSGYLGLLSEHSRLAASPLGARSSTHSSLARSGSSEMGCAIDNILGIYISAGSLAPSAPHPQRTFPWSGLYTGGMRHAGARF